MGAQYKIMKDNNKQSSPLTQVSTTYARICVILLALNFCVTGYVLNGVLKLQQETASVDSVTPTKLLKTGAFVPPAPLTAPSFPVVTRETEIEASGKE